LYVTLLKISIFIALAEHLGLPPVFGWVRVAHHSILSVPDEGYSRNPASSLNLISTFLLLAFCVWFSVFSLFSSFVWLVQCWQCL